MPISNSDDVLAMLKVYYEDGVENLMFRNSPVLRELKKEKIEGKSANFSAMYGRGGAVGADFVKAKQRAAAVAKTVEFAVTPGQVFSVYSINAKEVQASKTSKGAYMKVAGGKMFAAEEAFRKTLAATLYGRGYGELCKTNYSTAITAGTAFDLTLPTYAIMAIDIGSVLALKDGVDEADANALLTVEAINGNTVTVKSDTSVTSPAVTDVLCLDGSVDSSGAPLLPMGLAGWLPTVGKRTGSTWTSYIDTPFFGVKRSKAADRLAGAFYAAPSQEKKVDTVEALLQKCRRQGSAADLIVMNDEDFRDFAKEVETTNTFFTQTSSKGKKEATVGFDNFSASFSTNYIENIYDDPYCPKGIFYILDKEYVGLWAYTNTDKIDDGIAGNNPGKADPMEANDEGHENTPSGLIIDDYLNVEPGQASQDGPALDVSLQFYGSIVVQNPSVNGVGLFDGADPIEG